MSTVTVNANLGYTTTSDTSITYSSPFNQPEFNPGIVIGPVFYMVDIIDANTIQVKGFDVGSHLNVFNSTPIPSTQLANAKYILFQYYIYIGIAVVTPTGMKFVQINTGNEATQTFPLLTPLTDGPNPHIPVGVYVPPYISDTETLGVAFFQFGAVAFDGHTHVEAFDLSSNTSIGMKVADYQSKNYPEPPILAHGKKNTDGSFSFSLLHPSFSNVTLYVHKSTEGSSVFTGINLLPEDSAVSYGQTSNHTIEPRTIMTSNGHLYFGAVRADSVQAVSATITRVDLTTLVNLTIPVTIGTVPAKRIVQMFSHKDKLYVLTNADLKSVNVSTDANFSSSLTQLIPVTGTVHGMVPISYKIKIFTSTPAAVAI